MKNCIAIDVADRALTAMENAGLDTSDLRRDLALAVADCGVAE